MPSPNDFGYSPICTIYIDYPVYLARVDQFWRELVWRELSSIRHFDMTVNRLEWLIFYYHSHCCVVGEKHPVLDAMYFIWIFLLLSDMSQQRALELLRQAAAALERGNSSTTSNTDTTTTAYTSQSTASTSRTMAAVRNIFAPYQPYSANRTGARARRLNPTQARACSFWTHRFCVLAKTLDVSLLSIQLVFLKFLTLYTKFGASKLIYWFHEHGSMAIGWSVGCGIVIHS